MMYKVANNLTPNYMVQMFDKHYGSKNMTWEPQKKTFHSQSAKPITLDKVLPLREQNSGTVSLRI